MTDQITAANLKELIADSGADQLHELLSQLGPEEIGNVLAQLDASDFPALLEKIDPSVLETLAESISTPGELKRFLDLSGGQDAVIDEFVVKAGADTMLDRVFSLMGTRFLPDKVGGDSGAVEWRITTPAGQHVYHLNIVDGRAEGGRGPADNARTTLAMSGPDLLRLCAGTLDGVTAFMHNKIKLSGDMLFGAKLPAAFDIAG